MVKYCVEQYPNGSFPYQKSDGKFMNDTLYTNISYLAESIVNDMTFLAVVYSSTLEVGTGKSVLVQQIGEAYTERVNKLHGLNIKFDINNIVFKPKDLIARSFTLPKYSCIILDEWEDAHYWSELGITLRQFFRKCRQLNLFMIIIIPNFFQLNNNYAVGRSIFAIDVRFGEKFKRGFFHFYSFDKKKDLYNFGKKTQNYNAVRSDFSGTFPDGYAVPREEYLEKKRKDLEEAEKNKDNEKATQLREVLIKAYNHLKPLYPEIKQTDFAVALDRTTRSLQLYAKEEIP